MEVYGRNVLYRVLDGLLPLFDGLYEAKWQEDQLSSYHQQLSRALNLDLKNIKTAYDGVHLLTDFVSGMTDRYAVKIADMLYSR